VFAFLFPVLLSLAQGQTVPVVDDISADADAGAVEVLGLADAGAAPSEGTTSEVGPDESRVAEKPMGTTVRSTRRVAGERPVGATGSRFDVERDVLGASLTSIDTQQLIERGLMDTTGALQLVPGVTPVFEYGGFQFMTIRGFEEYTVLDDFRRDDRNTFVTSAPLSGLWDVERIEVLRGPSSASTGYSAIGGVINIIRKRPSRINGVTATVQGGTPEQYRAYVSANQGFLEKRLLFRVDVGTEYRRDLRQATTRRTGGSLTADVALSASQHLGIRLSGSFDEYNTDTGVPTVSGQVPAEVSLDRRFNTPQDGMTYSKASLDLDYEGRFAPGLQLVDRFRVALDDYRYLSTEGLTVPPEGGRVDREYFFLERHWRPLFNQIELSANVDLGRFNTRSLIGYELSLMDSTHPRSAVFKQPVASVPLGGLPGSDPQPAIEVLRDAEDTMTQVAHGFYAQERVTTPIGLIVDASVRVDRWQRTRRRDTIDPVSQIVTMPGTPSVFRTLAVTGRGSLIYKPVAASSTYFTVGNGYRPNEILNATNQGFAPQQALQFELGQSLTIKQLLTAHISGFWIQKSNVVVSLGEDRFDQAGGIRSLGFDVELNARFGRWLSGTATYAFTHAQFTSYVTQSGVDLSGKRPRIVAPHSGSFFLSSAPLERLKVSVGGRWQGEAFGDNANTTPLPAYFLLEAGTSYRFEGGLTLGATARNLLGTRQYFTSSINGNQLTPGPGREVLFTLQFER
jgi:iron complex outermembrane receptor protein